MASFDGYFFVDCPNQDVFATVVDLPRLIGHARILSWSGSDSSCGKVSCIPPEGSDRGSCRDPADDYYPIYRITGLEMNRFTPELRSRMV